MSESGPVPTTIVIVDWIGFIILLGSSMALCYKLMTFKGPSEQPVDYFFGYREAKMLPVYVNLFAAVAYWLKVSSHANGDVGIVATLDGLKYLEYVFTCPLLYKFTYGANIMVCIICATFSSLFDGPARYMWFIFGSLLFGVTWTSIVTLVRRRLEQFYSSNVFSKNIRKATKSMLRTALFCYFSLWVAYPVLWILLELNVITVVISHCLHVFLDVSAKSVYGFAMLRFQLSAEQREFTLDPLEKELPLVLGKTDVGDASETSDDELDKGQVKSEFVLLLQASATFVKVQYPPPTPRRSSTILVSSPRRTSAMESPTTLLRASSGGGGGGGSAVYSAASTSFNPNGRLLTPLMSPSFTAAAAQNLAAGVGPSSFEPFDRTLSTSSNLFTRGSSSAGGAVYDYRGRVSRSQTPAVQPTAGEAAASPRENTSPRFRRISFVTRGPEAAAAAAAGGSVFTNLPAAAGGGGGGGGGGGAVVVETSDAMEQMRALNAHLSRLLNQHLGAAAAASGGGGGGMSGMMTSPPDSHRSGGGGPGNSLAVGSLASASADSDRAGGGRTVAAGGGEGGRGRGDSDAGGRGAGSDLLVAPAAAAALRWGAEDDVTAEQREPEIGIA